MSEIIFHHYPPSPVSEKVRIVFGIKQLSWREVEQNRLPDRPELFAMTGGYRRIPVMQVGADIYCDTMSILDALEQIAPLPSLFPSGEHGLPVALSRWTDDSLFKLAVRVALIPLADELPPEFFADRARLYFGPSVDVQFERSRMAHTESQLRAHFDWIDQQLAAGRPYLAGESAGYADALVWYLYWFITERYASANKLFEPFEQLSQWASRMRAIGHGQSSPMTPAQALQVARDTSSTTAQSVITNDPLGLRAGQAVQISVDADTGEQPVHGKLHRLSVQSVAITRTDTRCGEVVVHFPRAGYRIEPTTD